MEGVKIGTLSAKSVLRGQKVEGTLLSKALTYMNFFCINKSGHFVKDTDTFGYIVVHIFRDNLGRGNPRLNILYKIIFKFDKIFFSLGCQGNLNSTWNWN